MTRAADVSTNADRVFIQFEGPWAFAPDPKDANNILAIAPKAKGHRELFVKASNDSALTAGTYDLSVPARSAPAAGTTDPGIAQAKIDAASLQHALDAKGNRYVIHLPKPEAYVVAGRSRSRVGTSYPPDASTEKEYATAVSLQYTVSSRAGFSIAGTPDSGVFNPMLLQVETPIVRFVIEPSQEDDPADKCDTLSRESFHNLVKLLGLTLYVDFPNFTSDCQKKDPQNSVPAKTRLEMPRNRKTAALSEALLAEGVPVASVVSAVALSGPLRFLTDNNSLESTTHRLLSATYFFIHPLVDCRSPILILGLK